MSLCTYPNCERLYGGCGTGECHVSPRKSRRVVTARKGLCDALNDTTVSISGTTITIQCGSHETKDAILNALTTREAAP